MIKFLIHNYSSVFGGQERYAVDLKNKLKIMLFKVRFSGGPLKLFENENENENECDSDVFLLNGNSALFKHGFTFLGGKFVVYIQHSNVNDAQSGFIKKTIRKILLKILLIRVNLVVRVCSNALPDYYAPGKIVTIYNGVNLPKNAELSKIKTTLSLLMVGGVTKNKNQKLALHALVKLPNARLTIVGTGPDVELLQLEAINIGVSDRVEWVGFVEDPTPYYQRADVLLMLSKYEAFPYVVLESMSHARPVISVKVGGVPEIIKDKYNGWLLDDYSIIGLVDAISRISSNEEEYLLISQNARKTIAEKFTVDHMVDKLLQEIETRIV